MEERFSILEYGACPDGQTINTTAIQKAIDACHKNGGGRVICPAGRFVTGSLLLKSNVELHLAAGCELIGSKKLDDYVELKAKGFITKNAPEGSAHCLIQAIEAENIAITGSGKINGSGLAFYDTSNKGKKLDKPSTPRPRILMLYQCRQVQLENFTLTDSPNWTIWLMQCEDIKIHALKIYGNRRMRNNDGLDIDACRNVTISDCIFQTEDDSLVLRAIQQVYETPAICENVVVTNCVLSSSCQGVRVGCPSDGVIRNCTLTNLTINSSNNGISMENPSHYLAPETSGTTDIHDIIFSNVTINCTNSPIKIFVDNGIKLNRIAGISFSNFRIQSGEPCMVIGNPETIIQDITFNNITLKTSGENAIVCHHCQAIKLTNVELSNKPNNTI